MGVGFEPTEDLRLHTLSSTAHHRSPPSVSVRTSADVGRADAGERPRTGVNETKTETTGWHARAARSGWRPVSVGASSRRPEPGPLIIVDSERTAGCGLSLITYSADYLHLSDASVAGLSACRSSGYGAAGLAHVRIVPGERCCKKTWCCSLRRSPACGGRSADSLAGLGRPAAPAPSFHQLGGAPDTPGPGCGGSMPVRVPEPAEERTI